MAFIYIPFLSFFPFKKLVFCFARGSSIVLGTSIPSHCPR